MKRKILLIDESLTVQKVVALTLDKTKYQLTFAKSRPEVMKLVLESPPDLILISDQMTEIGVASFPKEMETWLGGVREAAPVVLITGQDIKDPKHYAGVLKKPFSPQALQDMVQDVLKSRALPTSENIDELEDERLQKIFNDTFADESTLVRETFRAEVEAEEPTLLNQTAKRSRMNETEEAKTSLWEIGGAKNSPDLWGNNAAATDSASDLRASAAPVSEAEIQKHLDNGQLDALLDRMLTRLVPPIVEKLVNERLDKLLKEQENFLDLKT